MKKLISMLILFAMLLTMVACGAESSTQVTTEATVDAATEETVPAETTQGIGNKPAGITLEEMYGHINQLEPIDGVYKIWSAVGVQNMADHPDAEFEFLCHIDMGGVVVRPIGTEEKPFTGIIRGSDMNVSNFTVQGGDEECFGFVGVNQGQIRNLILSDVTFIPGENAKYIGGFAGKNEATILRSTINTSTMVVDKAPEGAVCGGAVGLNTAALTNSKVAVDIAYNATGSATIGGIAGIAKGGEVTRVETGGKLEISGTNKTVGLFTGISEDLVITDSAFLGAANTVDGVLFTNFTGNPDDDEMVVVTGAVMRDNSREEVPANIRALRDKVVKAMYDMGTIEWKVKQDLNYYDRVWSTTYTFKGIPYNHNSGSYAQARYIIGEDGYLIDEVYDWGTRDCWDMYFGSDCSSAVQQAWWTVSNSTDTFVVRYMHQQENQGGLAVGIYDWTPAMPTDDPSTEPVILANDEQVMYESYACLLAGDAVAYSNPRGGHTRLIAEDAVVVRDQNGLIDPQRSYVISHEQGNAVRNDVEGTYSSWNIGRKQTFANLYYDWALPVTCKELLTGEVDPVEAYLEGAIEGYAGLISGTVHANYNLDSVTIYITDADGNVVLDHILWPDVQKSQEYGNYYFSGRVLNEKYDLSNVAILLANTTFEKGQTYHYTITANLSTFDSIQVHKSSFVFGQ